MDRPKRRVYNANTNKDKNSTENTYNKISFCCTFNFSINGINLMEILYFFLIVHFELKFNFRTKIPH